MFRTVPGTKLDAAIAGMVVAFEVDNYGSSSEPWGWSVLVRGVAEEITDRTELQRVQSLGMESWALDVTADRYVKIELTIVTGRRIIPPEGIT